MSVGRQRVAGAADAYAILKGTWPRTAVNMRP